MRFTPILYSTNMQRSRKVGHLKSRSVCTCARFQSPPLSPSAAKRTQAVAEHQILPAPHIRHPLTSSRDAGRLRSQQPRNPCNWHTTTACHVTPAIYILTIQQNIYVPVAVGATDAAAVRRLFPGFRDILSLGLCPSTRARKNANCKPDKCKSRNRTTKREAKRQRLDTPHAPLESGAHYGGCTDVPVRREYIFWFLLYVWRF